MRTRFAWKYRGSVDTFEPRWKYHVHSTDSADATGWKRADLENMKIATSSDAPPVCEGEPTLTGARSPESAGISITLQCERLGTADTCDTYPYRPRFGLDFRTHNTTFVSFSSGSRFFSRIFLLAAMLGSSTSRSPAYATQTQIKRVATR